MEQETIDEAAKEARVKKAATAKRIADLKVNMGRRAAPGNGQHQHGRRGGFTTGGRIKQCIWKTVAGNWSEAQEAYHTHVEKAPHQDGRLH